MVKLFYSNDFNPTVEAGATIVNSTSDLNKTAAAISDEMMQTVKPDKNHTGILVVALGDDEHYGANRNGDSFTAETCKKYHPTFVEHGHVFRHHRNKDAKTQGIGDIKLSKYNPEMGRIELYIHADNEKAAPELERLEKEGTIPFSMACRVPWDRCSICGAKRKHAGDDSECEHIKNHLGDLQDDGKKVFTYNDEPDFFDISFVGRPADRIAWDLLKTKAQESSEKKASFGTDLDPIVPSYKMAELEGVFAPDTIEIKSAAAVRKFGYAKQLADLHSMYRGWLTKSSEAITVKDRYLYEIHKIASCELDDSTISKLREYTPRQAFTSLGAAGIIMDVPSFFKYAMGPRFDEIKDCIPSIEKKASSVFDEAVSNGFCQRLCNETAYDAEDYSKAHAYDFVPRPLQMKLASYSMILNPSERIIEKTASGKINDFIVDTKTKNVFNVDVINKLTEKYAAYKLSAIDAVLCSHRGSVDPDTVVALSAAQNLLSTSV